jgi:Glycosyl hydrolase family 9
MLGMSFVFYEIQRAGPLPSSTRLPWRGDTIMDNGKSMDGDYAGGYFDAGDHLKFQLPGAYAIARLCWLVWQFKDGLEGTYFDVRCPAASGCHARMPCLRLQGVLLSMRPRVHSLWWDVGCVQLLEHLLRCRVRPTMSGRGRPANGALTTSSRALRKVSFCCTLVTLTRIMPTLAVPNSTPVATATSCSATLVRRTASNGSAARI